jgi:hypothetical protein
MKKLIIPILLLTGMTACASSKPSPVTTPIPISVAPTTNLCDPLKDSGCGKPGAFCATSRLGKSFVYKSVTYTCKGPKPYKWRK